MGQQVVPQVISATRTTSVLVLRAITLHPGHRVAYRAVPLVLTLFRLIHRVAPAAPQATIQLPRVKLCV